MDIDRRVRFPGRRRSFASVFTVGAVLGASLGALSGPLSGAAPLAHAQGTVTVVADDVDDANTPSLSADGRWIVFGGLVGTRRTVFRTDRTTAETTEISPVPRNTPGGDTIHARLSADGCVVVAVTEIAFDLFRDNDRRDRWDVYRLVVPECGGQPNAWELVSMDRTGAALDGVLTDSAPSLSGSGAVIAFVEQLRDAPEGVGTIRVVDVTVPPHETGREQTVAGMPVEAPNRAYVYRGAREPALSENGRHLAFVSDTTSSSPLPGWASGQVPGGEATAQVFVWDRAALDQRRSVHLVSGRDGAATLTGASSPAISDDGRIVAFVSGDRTLLPTALSNCRAVCPSQVYRFDRDTDRNGIFDEEPRRPPLTIVSAVSAADVPLALPVAGNASSWAPALSGDGSQVAFVTDATNLLPSRRGGGGSRDDGDLLVYEVELDELRRVVEAAGVPGAHGHPSLSRTGQVVAFDTAATDTLNSAGVSTGRRSIAAAVVTPQLSLAQVDFGTVLADVDSTELYVRVQNAGPAAFAPVVFQVTGSFRVTGGTCAKGIIVAAGSSCSVNLVFRPAGAGRYSGTLTVSGDGPLAPAVSTTVRGSVGDPVLQASPGGIDLAPGIVGGAGGRVAIDIVNISFAPTRIARLEIGGADPDDFLIATESCTGGRALNPDGSCAVEIEFHPTAAGYRSALLLAVTNTGEYTAAIVGGFADHQPTMQLAEAVVDPGGSVGVAIGGFPAGAAVSIGFDDGSSPLAVVTIDEAGGALVLLDVPLRVRGGERLLVASTGEVTATAPIEVTVVRRRSVPGMPGYGMG